MTYTDAEIEELANTLDQRFFQKPVPAPETAMKFRYEHEPDEDCRKAAQALRHLLKERNALLAESASYTCKHLSTKKAGALWWLCEDCGAYFATVSTSAQEAAE